MFRASPQQVKGSLSTAEKLSGYYATKYPEIGYDEFYSIALEAIAKACEKYNPKKGELLPRVRTYIYHRFHDYLEKNNRSISLRTVPCNESMEDVLEKLEDILSKVNLPKAQEQAIEYYIKYKEPPLKERHHFYDAIKTIRKEIF